MNNFTDVVKTKPIQTQYEPNQTQYKPNPPARYAIRNTRYEKQTQSNPILSAVLSGDSSGEALAKAEALAKTEALAKADSNPAPL